MKGGLWIIVMLGSVGGLITALKADRTLREVCRIETFLQMEKPGLCKYYQ